MITKKTVLSAIIGAGLMAMPVGALAAGRFAKPAIPQSFAWQVPAHHSPITLADNDDGHHGHHRHHHHRRHHEYNGGYYGPNYTYTPPTNYRGRDWDDYHWGGHNRYQYPPSYFAQPLPQGYAGPQRRNYLEQRRSTALMMQREMNARGDTAASNRLGTTINQLNRALGYR